MKEQDILRISCLFLAKVYLKIQASRKRADSFIKLGSITLLLQPFVFIQAQEYAPGPVPLDSILQVNCYELILENDCISGSGFEMLMGALEGAQLSALSKVTHILVSGKINGTIS